METPDIVEFARNFSVMVRIQGPDPKGLKMRGHAFHLHQSGNTTLSASGLLLPTGSLSENPRILDHIANIHHHSGALVVTTASVVEPFLSPQHRDNSTQELFPKLIPNAHIDVLVEGKEGWSGSVKPDTASVWLPSKLLALVDVPTSFDALMSLVGVHSGSHEQTLWEVGWSLAPLSNDSQTGMDAFRRQVGNDLRSSLKFARNFSSDVSNNVTLMAKLATRFAILGVSTVNLKDLLHISQLQRRGDYLIVMGSPFGVLSPLHFYNSISLGSVANCCPPDSNHSSLLMADIHCLPGMEGGPVFDKNAYLVGILTRPLSQKGGNAEIQLVVTWHAIATAYSAELQKEAQRMQGRLTDRNINSVPKDSSYSLNSLRRSVKHFPKGRDFPWLSQSSLEKAISSIALVTVGDGAWASGIVLNNRGLILTNAHVLEPWRFGRTSLLGRMDKLTALSFKHEKPLSKEEENVGNGERRILFPSRLGTSNGFVHNGHEAPSFSTNYRSYKKISVRLVHMEQRIWYDASVVYVSRGPFDVALLQLETVPDQLCAITPEFGCPATGLTVHVIGHGLLGPRSDSSPSISSGVLSSVIRMPGSIHPHESSKMEAQEEKNLPIMLQTTASVHPGASGGAVVNSDGHMIGLITSNARHGGGTIIPHMNFSIPCAALEPIFKFSDNQDLSVLQVLDKPNKCISSVWALVPLPSPMPQAPLQKNNWEEKGSRFSQFLAEKRAELTPLKDQKHLMKQKLISKI